MISGLFLGCKFSFMTNNLLAASGYAPLRLHTFNQVLFDQLMPWLPENNDVLFYRAWQHVVAKASKTPYLFRLAQVYERNNRLLPSDLLAEWQLIGNNSFSALIREIYLSLKSQELSSLKLFFYRDLIAQAFAHSYVYCMAQFRSLSAERKQFELRQLMRRLDDLTQNSRRIYKDRQAEDTVIVYLVHLSILVFRQLLRDTYHTILTPDIVLLNNQLLKPDYQSDYPQSDVLNRLYEWHVQTLPKIIDQFAGSGGSAIAMSDNTNNPTEADLHTNFESLFAAEKPTETAAYSKQQKQEVSDKHDTAKTQTLLSTAEASKLLGISPSGLRKQAKQGTFNPIRIGKLFKFPKEDIIAYKHRKN